MSLSEVQLNGKESGEVPVDNVASRQEAEVADVNAMDVDGATHKPEDPEQELLKSKAPRLPMSKVKKIARCDPEYMMTSNAAFIATSFATEIFIKTLTEEALVLAQLHNNNSSSNNTKQVKRLTYESLSKCIQRNEKFQFLNDVIPATKNLKSLVKENKVRYSSATLIDRNQQKLPSMSTNKSGSEDSAVNADGSGSMQNQDVEEDNDDTDGSDDEAQPDDEDEEDFDDVPEEELAQEKYQKEVQEKMDEISKQDHVEDIDKNDAEAHPENAENAEINSDTEN